MNTAHNIVIELLIPILCCNVLFFKLAISKFLQLSKVHISLLGTGVRYGLSLNAILFYFQCTAGYNFIDLPLVLQNNISQDYDNVVH